MRLLEAILDANHRAVAGDTDAGLRPADYESSLPVVALTCIDPRLNAFFPNVLALPDEQFIWLRNAGNIITGPLSSTMRSLALACALKGGEEIAVIGHTDCQVARTPIMLLLDRLQALGVDRRRLPDNVNDFFGTFGSERQNVIKACEHIRNSPLVGPKIPVHGLLLDIETGKLDWVINGYETLLPSALPEMPATPKPDFPKMDPLGSFKDFVIGEIKFPEAKIGEMANKVQAQIQDIKPVLESAQATAENIADYAQKHWPQPPVAKPPPLPAKQPPPPVRPRPNFKRK